MVLRCRLCDVFVCFLLPVYGSGGMRGKALPSRVRADVCFLETGAVIHPIATAFVQTTSAPESHKTTLLNHCHSYHRPFYTAKPTLTIIPSHPPRPPEHRQHAIKVAEWYLLGSLQERIKGLGQ